MLSNYVLSVPTVVDRLDTVLERLFTLLLIVVSWPLRPLTSVVIVAIEA